jgi:hypothetical protein
MGKHRSVMVAVVGIVVMAFMVAISLNPIGSSRATYTAYCGDGFVNQVNEQCDRYDFDGKTCVSLGYSYGVLKCTSSCTFDKSGCRPIRDVNPNPREPTVPRTK